MKEKVSVIIPVRNEEKFISKCIESILKQDYPKELIEIVVVDGMSDDSTVNIIEGYINNYKNIKLIFNEKCVTPISLNLGIKESTGEIVIILGGHSFIHKYFIKNNVRNLVEKNVQCSGGVIETINEGILGESIAQAMSCPFGVGNALFRYAKEEKYVDTVAFGAYKKSTLDQIGYFDEELVRNQDDEINLRLANNGGRILLSPDIKSWYYSRPSLKKLWNQYKQYGFWKVRVIQKHKKPASLRHLVPVTFIVSLILGGVGALFSRILLYMLSAIVLSYMFLNIVFSFKLALKSSYKHIFYLPVIFTILHLSYGWGFLMGIFNFYIFKSNKIKNDNTVLSR